MMKNLKDEIIQAVGNELDTAIIRVTSDDGVDEEKDKFPENLIEVPVQLKNVITYFDYMYDNGFGAQECHTFYIWTLNKVFYIHEYDGSTCIASIPRNPRNIMRKMNTQHQEVKQESEEE